MFDTYVTRKEINDQHITVSSHEHRAPTDESVRLLREMEAAARKNVIDAITIRCKDNKVVFSQVVESIDPISGFNKKLTFVFSVNGYPTRAIIDKPDWYNCRDMPEITQEMFKLLSEEIARQMIGEMFDKWIPLMTRR